MNRKVLALLVSVLFLAFTGCKPAAKNVPDSIEGTWKDSYGFTKYKFGPNGRAKVKVLNLGSFDGSYKVSDNKLTIEYRVIIKDVDDTYKYKIDGDTLYLDDKKFTREK